MDAVTHVWEQSSHWVASSPSRKVKNASWHLRCSHNVLCSTRGSGKGGSWENGSTRALRLQLWRAPVLDKCFAEGNKANFLTSKWQTQTRVSYVRDCHFRHAVTWPNVFSIAVNRQKGMILGSLGVLVLLHFGFRF